MSAPEPSVRTSLPPLRGMELLHDPRTNKGTAFTQAEREALGLVGLLPPRVFTEAEQVERTIQALRRKSSDIERHVALAALAERNRTLFHRVLLEHVTELMPIVYTPTVGEACQRYGHLFQRSRGLFVSADDRGRIREVLRSWPEQDIRVIVVTDGSRILGLGDLGAHGMGIPVGKLTLYTVCAGVDPNQCLPITLDVGCDTAAMRDDPLYVGLQRPRLTGQAYDDILHEFVTAVQEVFPRVLLQFEDFANHAAFALLERYRDELCCFNDDIQGTAAVAVAGVLSASRVTGTPLAAQRLLFLGAGEAGLGIAELLVRVLVAEGVAEGAARAQCWFWDSKGLVTADRRDLGAHKRRFAHVCPGPTPRDLLGALELLQPNGLIGVSGQPQTITAPMVAAMCARHARPLVFALSNPTSKAECTAEQAYTWSDGRALFASGSPFPPYVHRGRTHVPGQGNNAYIFPGVGLGVVASGARRVPEDVFVLAARTLAAAVGPDDLERGSLYPPLASIRAVSLRIAVAVAGYAFEHGLASVPRPRDLEAWVQDHVYVPTYPTYA